LIGRRLVPLHHLYLAAYDMERLRAEIIARMPAEALVSRRALLWRAVRAGNHGLILVIIIIAAAGLVKALKLGGA
jgi:hypothetical protein